MHNLKVTVLIRYNIILWVDVTARLNANYTACHEKFENSEFRLHVQKSPTVKRRRYDQMIRKSLFALSSEKRMFFLVKIMLNTSFIILKQKFDNLFQEFLYFLRIFINYVFLSQIFKRVNFPKHQKRWYLFNRRRLVFSRTDTAIFAVDHKQ